ncbi:MAG: hypothetical protein ACK4UP_10910 [Spirosomataceae bacterium]
MKKNIFYYVLILLNIVTYNQVFSQQRVDLDRFYFDVQYQKLPQLFVLEGDRTVGIRTRIGQSIKDFTNNEQVYDNLTVYGWKKVEQNPTLGIDFTLDDFVYKGSTVKNRTDVEKDKDGKIIKNITYYWIEATFLGRGNCIYTGPELPKPEKVTKEEKPVNKFLQNVTIEKEEDFSSTRIPLDISYTYTSQSTTSSKGLVEQFTVNKDAIYSDYLRTFTNDAVARVNNRLNHIYGFSPMKARDYLWIQNSKKHEEYDTQAAAIEAVKVLFSKMEVNEPTEKVKESLGPLLEYLESLKSKYAGEDKNNVKMRYSAFYNKAKIYYYLDMPQEMITEAEGLIKNGYDESDGKLLLETARRLVEEFKRTGLNTRHVPFNN